MAVFRIEETRDYTVMANHHLRNTALSLKAKGLLSLMLSLPEDWDYLMPRLAREAGATEALKAADPMKWVGLMNNCKARAEEIVMHELIYV